MINWKAIVGVLLALGLGVAGVALNYDFKAEICKDYQK